MNNSQKNIKHRRQELIKLLGAGYPIDIISKQLKVSIQTIYEDKRQIGIIGFKQLKTIGPEELLFYYQTIESSIRHKKLILWSILNSVKVNGSATSNTKSKYTLEQILKTIEQDSRLDTQLKELYKDTSNLINKDYRTTVRLISLGLSKARQGISMDNIEEFKQLDIINSEYLDLNNKPKNPYMDLDLPKKDSKNVDSIEP